MAVPRLRVSVLHSYLIVAGVATLFFFFNFFHFIDFRELDAVDMRMRLRGAQEAHPDIVIIAIDDSSLAQVGQWPWPREFHAALLDVLRRYGPRCILMDMLFTEESPDPEQDAQLAYALRRAGNVILMFFYTSEDPFRATFPIPAFRESAASLGFANIAPDFDGHIRRLKVAVKSPGGKFYHGAVLTLRAQFQDTEDADEWIRSLPLDGRGQLWIRYPGPVESFQSISFMELINAAGTEKEAEMRKLFKDKIVLIGHTATATTDLKPAVFSPTYPGVAVIASAIDTMLKKKYLRTVPPWADWLILVFLSLMVAWVKRNLPARNSLLIFLGITAVYVIVNFVCFYLLGRILLLFVPLVSMVFSFMLILFIMYMEAMLQEQMISRELATATRIQESFLPVTNPDFGQIDLKFQCRFAKQVGGDLYDWIDFEDGRYGVCVGDVSGKGVPAAIYMARAISDFRRENRPEFTPAQVLEAVNLVLSRDSTAGMFVTVLYGVIHPKAGKIVFANAGHEPVAFYHAAQNKTEIIDIEKGPPIGLFEGVAYENVEMPFHEGDAVVFMSDGVKELRNPKGEEFGLDRVREIVRRQAASLDAEGLVERLFYHLERFRSGAAPHDDRTLLCLKLRPAS